MCVLEWRDDGGREYVRTSEKTVWRGYFVKTVVGSNFTTSVVWLLWSGVGHVVPNCSPPVSRFDTRTRVKGSQSGSSGSYDSTRKQWTLLGLHFGKLTWVKNGISLEVPIVSYIFVFKGRFPVITVSNFLVVACTYSFFCYTLETFVSVSKRNEGLPTSSRGRYKELV